MNIQPSKDYITHLSSDYARFIPPSAGRPVSAFHVNKLARSMKKYGFVRNCPVIVRQKRNKLQVIMGNHRVLAAAKAGVPVCFLIDNKMTDEEALKVEAFRPALARMQSDMGWTLLRDHHNPDTCLMREPERPSAPRLKK